MSSDNHSFKITDERLEWERTDPWKTPEAQEESSDGNGQGDTVVKSSERRRTLIIAGEGALAGGLLGAFVATVVVLSSSSSGSASPRPPVHPAPAHRKSSAVVLGPAVRVPKSHAAITHKAGTKPHGKQTHNTKAPRITNRHTDKAPRKHTQPASTKHIRFRPRQNESNPAHHNHWSSK